MVSQSHVTRYQSIELQWEGSKQKVIFFTDVFLQSFSNHASIPEVLKLAVYFFNELALKGFTINIYPKILLEGLFLHLYINLAHYRARERFDIRYSNVFFIMSISRWKRNYV